MRRMLSEIEGFNYTLSNIEALKGKLLLSYYCSFFPAALIPLLEDMSTMGLEAKCKWHKKLPMLIEHEQIEHTSRSNYY